VAGQREWGWVSQQLGIPNFPQDFPDCPAAAELAQSLAAEQVSPVLLLLTVSLLKILLVCFAASSTVEAVILLILDCTFWVVHDWQMFNAMPSASGMEC